jgi:hypothetical protein
MWDFLAQQWGAGGASVDTHVAATQSVTVPSVSLDRRWPVWSRLAILIGGSAVLWAGLGWVAFQILKLG